MARWRLLAGHYLYTNPSTEWEYKETSRETGRQTRMVAKVPRLLEPKDPADHNYPGEIVVSNGNNAQRFDIIFLGDPTPDMEPIDDEAKRISNEFIAAGKWKKPEEGEVLGESLIRNFMEQIAKVQMAPPQPISANTVSAEAFAELQAQVKALTEQNAKLTERSGRRA